MMNRRDALSGLALTAATALSAGLIGSASATDRSTLLTRSILSTGETLPVIGLGTSGVFEHHGRWTQASLLLQAFVAAGGKVIDTSPMYSTEALLGELLTPSMQGHTFLAGKVWTRGETAGIEQMRESLRQMGRANIELMQVHNLRDVHTQLRTLRRWKEEGCVRYIGVSHYTIDSYPRLISLMRDEHIDFVQLNYSALTREAEQRLLPTAADLGVAVLVNRPFECGQLINRLAHTPLPGWATALECQSWPQLLLKYVVSHPAVTCVIPAAATLTELQDNLSGGCGVMPTSRERERIATLIAAA